MVNIILGLIYNTFILLTIPGFTWHFINRVFFAHYTVNGSLLPSRRGTGVAQGDKGREPRKTGGAQGREIDTIEGTLNSYIRRR